jgi:DNA-binding GntR family transcriptional regulator
LKQGRDRVAVELSASAVAYDRLKRAIVSAEIRPGTPIVEAALVEQYGFGRTPLREALQRLAGDGLVVILPRRGTIVSHLGLHETRELFEARIVVEGETASLAAQRSTHDERAGLVAINDEIHAIEAHNGFVEFLAADQRLHREIMRLAQNKYLGEAADRILTLNEWLWHVHFNRHGVSSSDLASHDAIVDAITAGDAVGARQAMVEHIERSRALLRVAI